MPTTSSRFAGATPTRSARDLRQDHPRDHHAIDECKAIGRFGLGVDNIDLRRPPRKKGIAVNYVPDYCIREVVSTTHARCSFASCCIRKRPLSNKHSCRPGAGNARRRADPPHRGHELWAVGFGQYSAAGRAEGAGVRHQGDRLRPFAKPELFQQAGSRASISIAACALRLHLGACAADAADPGCERGRVRENEKRRLRREHRARTADRRAGARRRARLGQVGGAALDVVTEEPLAKNSALLGRDNVIVTPHTAFYPDRGARRIAVEMRERRRARPQRREGGVSDQRMRSPHTPLIRAQAGIQLNLSIWHVGAGSPLWRGERRMGLRR